MLAISSYFVKHKHWPKKPGKFHLNSFPIYSNRYLKQIYLIDIIYIKDVYLWWRKYKHLQSKSGFEVAARALSNWLPVHLCFPRWENYSSAERNMNV